MRDDVVGVAEADPVVGELVLVVDPDATAASADDVEVQIDHRHGAPCVHTGTVVMST